MATPPTSRPPSRAGARPTNDDIEAVIQMATSSLGGSAHLPPRDTRTQLFVGNLPYRVRWQDLKDLFRRAGTVLRADVSLAPDNRSRGYGTVLLATAEDAGRAVDMFNGFVWQTRTLEVRLDRMAAEDHQLQLQGLSGGVGLGSAPGSASASGTGTPFGPINLSRVTSSPALFPLDERYLKAVSPIIGLGSPTALSAQLTGNQPLSAHVTGNNVERSRNLFVGNLPFHIQWQDLKDLFRQGGTILRADVALGPDGRSRGFGTVTFATEADAERAVRMFNGYEFNGRQLKVHFDKFSASSATALPMTGFPPSSHLGTSLSAPQSPRAGPRPPAIAQASSFAQQLLMHQHEQARQNHAQLSLGLDATHDGPSQSPLDALRRANTDTHTQTFRFNMLSEDGSHALSDVASAVPRSLFEPPSSLTRSKSDSTQLYPYTGVLQGPRMDSQRQRQHLQSQLYSSSQDHAQQQMHISLPAARPPYAYDFSPGSPYEVYHLSSAEGSNTEGWQPERASAQSGLQWTSNMSEAILRDPLSHKDEVPGTHTRPSTSPSPVPLSDEFARARTHALSQHAYTRSESFPMSSSSISASVQNDESQTQTLTSGVTSPTTSHKSASLQSATSGTAASPNATHPAHPGPITLPPPPSVSAFPAPPAHTLTPHGGYHPQMSPYASPLHHPAVMMGMMGMNMTPHGLPPITPSMPSFTFLPQPSPTVPTAQDQNASSNQQGAPSSNSSAEQQQQQHYQSAYLAHLHHAHGPMISPYSPFSPGVAMSPGAFWGRPGSAAVNPYINPAVGAPVHGQSGYFPPVASTQSHPEEPREYFPPFASDASTSVSKPSGLANEIQPDQASVSGSAGDSSVAGGEFNTFEATPSSSGTTVGTSMTGPGTSPYPPSSNGTSWQTDSADPSPVVGLTKDIERLGVQDRHGAPKPRASSTGAMDGEYLGLPQSFTRAHSDPVQANSASSSTKRAEAPKLTLATRIA